MAEPGSSSDLLGLAAVLDAALDCVIVMDAGGRVVEFNTAAQLAFGYQREEALGVELAALIVPPAMRPRHRAGLARVLATGKSEILGKRIELTAMRSDGSEFPVELTVTRAEGSGLFVGFVRDLTVPKRAERRLAAQHHVTQILAEGSSIAEAGPQVLEAVCRSLGWQLGCLWRLDDRRHELRCMSIWHPGEVEAEEFARATHGLRLEQGRGLPGRVWRARAPAWVENLAAEAEFPRAGVAALAGLHGAFGAPIMIGGQCLGVIEFFSNAVREPDEDLLQMIGAIGSQLAQFIDRKQSEETVRRSEESYRLLFQQHPGPMWVYEPGSLRFLAVNEAAVAMYGYSADEFRRMTIADIRPPEDVPALLKRLERSDGDLGGSEVWRHRKADGTVIDVSIVSSRIDFEGQRARLVLAQDVTEQRRLEEHLRQSQKMEAVGQLAGGIAHDFNNILTAIVGFAAVSLRQVRPEDPLHDNLSEIVRAGDRAGALITQLLAFSRRQLLLPRVLDLREVVRSMEPMLRRLIREDIELEFELDEKIGHTRLDPGQLEQVLLNLVLNARAAMPNGGKLTISTDEVTLDESYALAHAEIEPGCYVVLAVTDTGIGMDRETQARVFEPFFTTRGEGTGLGLASVYGIVKQSKGYIWVYSEPDRGATFKLYFPCVDQPVEDLGAEPDLPVRAVTGTETILIVEDEEQLGRLLERILLEHGYTLLQARTGEEALAIAAAHRGPLHLVLTDVVLPATNGPELVAALSTSRPGIRVLYMSGYAEEAVIATELRDAKHPFLPKPFTPSGLAQAVRDVLDAPS